MVHGRLGTKLHRPQGLLVRAGAGPRELHAERVLDGLQFLHGDELLETVQSLCPDQLAPNIGSFIKELITGIMFSLI